MDLKQLRDLIDKVDDQIATLYMQRLDLVRQVGEYKKQNDVVVEHNDREQQILDRLADKFGDRTATDYLYNSIMTYSKMEQNILQAKESGFVFQKNQQDISNETNVGLAGTTGAYAEKAAKKLFPQMQPKFYTHFGDVFDAVDKGEIKYGIVPIENSTAGSVNEVYDLLKEYDIKIVGSQRLTVNHCLLGQPGAEIGDIKKVYSHPQALYQCKKFLDANGIQPVEESNTAVACELVAKMGDKTVGAIGAENNAQKNGLSVLKCGVQNAEHNFTRFIVISKQMTISPDADRLSLMVSLKHKPGSLFQLLSILSSFKVDLLKLESRPIPEQEFEFMFYVDIKCDVFSERTQTMLACIKAYCQTTTILGAYSEVI
ncbi:MAG: chorismate mutase [Clostridia bacterium]|nr:chorismate mutase [Clostridia bacterium]